MAEWGDAIQRAVEGDRTAQQFIYESLSSGVHRLVLRIVGISDADDVTQDVFCHILEKIHTFRAESDFATWVHRVAVNDALQHLRERKRHRLVPLDENKFVSKSKTNSRETKELFDTALLRIDPELRVIIELKEFEKMTYAKIAEIMSIPEGTVGSRLNRARRELRNQLIFLGWEI